MNKRLKKGLKWLKYAMWAVLLYLAFDIEWEAGVALAVTLFLMKIDYED